jgi:membrane protein implicated in regulation of membrane protease activity
MNSFCTVDWQALGTWVEAVALVIICALDLWGLWYLIEERKEQREARREERKGRRGGRRQLLAKGVKLHVLA